MANTSGLLNPSTPLAFLPPTLASQFEVSRYVYAATLGAYVWDIGLNLGNDYALLVKHRWQILLVDRLRVFFGGRGSSALSQALLRSGQHFYLVAVAANITLLAVLHLSPVTHTMLSVPAFAMVNAMACLVFRRIKFGLISSDGVSIIPTIGLSSNFHATANPSPLPLHSRRTDPTAMEIRMNTAFPLGVRMQTEIDIEEGALADPSEEMPKPTNLP
ncbi:hypothetical protein MSAN_01065800 [Mycena sanguinolenta]|uniref:Uncharacterized protein n=1 Tax=Mycena sanguinolenta TaxID=230812 RepID=A0A8H6YUE9_9AGAR|nr:hypothetical protein MSAN_01065800 [Mycena sanguinolenta]